MILYRSVLGKHPWVLKHNSRYWPAWALTWDQNPIRYAWLTDSTVNVHFKDSWCHGDCYLEESLSGMWILQCRKFIENLIIEPHEGVHVLVLRFHGSSCDNNTCCFFMVYIGAHSMQVHNIIHVQKLRFYIHQWKKPATTYAHACMVPQVHKGTLHFITYMQSLTEFWLLPYYTGLSLEITLLVESRVSAWLNVIVTFHRLSFIVFQTHHQLLSSSYHSSHSPSRDVCLRNGCGYGSHGIA